ncbi:MAG: hypothetical protein AAF411_15495 [Myxococcota bacterium]
MSLATSAVVAQADDQAPADDEAAADDQSPIDARADDEAREIFEAGEASYRRGDYRRALDYFRHAYSLSPRPELLFNIGNAAERAREDETAIEYYERYLEALPDAENRQMVERRLTALRQDADVEPADVPSASPPRRVWTWVAGGLTVGLTTLGVAGRLRGNAAFDELEERCGGTTPRCTDAQITGSSVKGWERLTVTSFALAGASAVGFVLALILETPEDDDAVALDVGPTGVSLRGSF